MVWTTLQKLDHHLNAICLVLQIQFTLLKIALKEQNLSDWKQCGLWRNRGENVFPPATCQE